MQAQLGDDLRQRRVRGLARRAQRPDQALRQDADHRRCQQVVFDAHVEQTVDGARGIVGVNGRQHQVTGQRRLHRDLRGFQVADLADHDDVGVLPHDRAQRVGERQIDLRLDLDLVDAGHLVFDRVLDGEDLDVGLVQAIERRIQRRRLAAAGRPGDEQDAVRFDQHVEESLQRVVLEAESLEVERDAALVEDPHHDRLAVHRRHRRYAQIDLLALHAQPDAPVLRQTPLGDVEIGHDLDARDHRGGKAPRRRLDLVQHAVDPVAHDQPVLERLDVDVGRARVERIGDDQRHQADHRRFGGEILQLLDVGVEGEIVALLDVAQDLAERRFARAVQPLERRLELHRNRDLRPHLAPGDHLERIDRVLVGRIGHRQRKLGFVFGERQRARFAQESRRHALLEYRKLGVAGGLDQRQSELIGQRLRHVALRDDAERDQQHAELLAGVLLNAQGAVQARGIELAALDQHLAESFSFRCVHTCRRMKINARS